MQVLHFETRGHGFHEIGHARHHLALLQGDLPTVMAVMGQRWLGDREVQGLANVEERVDVVAGGEQIVIGQPHIPVLPDQRAVFIQKMAQPFPFRALERMQKIVLALVAVREVTVVTQRQVPVAVCRAHPLRVK